MAKITSVLELARYKIGETAYRVALISDDASMHGAQAARTYSPLYKHTWLDDGCDKGYKRKQITNLRQKIGKPPHLSYEDYSILIPFLAADLLVVEYNVSLVYRCSDTGEFWYEDENGVKMPELYLFDTIVAARRERNKIVKQIRKWVVKNG